MQDLGEAASSAEPLIMLGGGNPGTIEAIEQHIRSSIHEFADSTELGKIIGSYDSPQGDHRFIGALVELLNKECGWDLSERNIAITNGSQSAFFLLFNLLGGKVNGDSADRRILLPLAPEYIGYADTGVDEGLFTAKRPLIEHLDQHTFKYHVDIDTLVIDDSIGAVSVSRPTNPTGNVLTDNELQCLVDAARRRDVPVIIDGAYGLPFPNLVYVDAAPVWNENIILCLSLSKFGMPGARTGIVVAEEAIIDAITACNAIMSLSVGSLGPAIAYPLAQSGELTELSRSVIKPFYECKAKHATDCIHRFFGDTPWRMHRTEGAFFIWLWFEGLPISAQELYERLKARRVFVIAGQHFFPGLEADPWHHKHECIRVTYAMDDAIVEAGLQIIGEEVQRAYDSRSAAAAQ